MTDDDVANCKVYIIEAKSKVCYAIKILCTYNLNANAPQFEVH